MTRICWTRSACWKASPLSSITHELASLALWHTCVSGTPASCTAHSTLSQDSIPKMAQPKAESLDHNIHARFRVHTRRTQTHRSRVVCAPSTHVCPLNSRSSLDTHTQMQSISFGRRNPRFDTGWGRTERGQEEEEEERDQELLDDDCGKRLDALGRHL